jgi:hypothetical protein
MRGTWNAVLVLSFCVATAQAQSVPSTSTAVQQPWYLQTQVMAAIVSSIATLTGVLAGGLFSSLWTMSLERRRWKREDTARYLSERHIVYSSFLGEGSRLALSTDPETGRVSTADMKEFLAQLVRIEIIGSVQVVQAAKMFANAVADQLTNQGGKQLPINTWNTSRTRLIEAARKELGIDAS